MLAFLGLFILTLLAVLGTAAGGMLTIGGVAFAVLAATLTPEHPTIGPLLTPPLQRWAIMIGLVAAAIGLALYIAAGALLAASLP